MQNCFIKGEESVTHLGEITKDELEMLKKLKRVNSIELTSCEKRCYDLLVKIEKEISWETLLKIKASTFLIESDNLTWENPYFNAH